MKKIICLLLIFVMVLSMAACAAPAKTIRLPDRTPEDTEASDQTQTTEATEPTEQTVPYTEVSYTTELLTTQAIYAAPDHDSEFVQGVDPAGTYTIVAEAWDSQGNLWGKLESGIGWVLLKDANCICRKCDGYFDYIGLHKDGLCEECYAADPLNSFGAIMDQSDVWNMEWIDSWGHTYCVDILFEDAFTCHALLTAAGLDVMGCYSGSYAVENNEVVLILTVEGAQKEITYTYDPVNERFTQTSFEGLAYYHVYGDRFSVTPSPNTPEDITRFIGWSYE